MGVVWHRLTTSISYKFLCIFGNVRTTKKLSVQLDDKFIERLLVWACQFDEVVWMDSNDCKREYSSYKAILAVDAFTSIKTDHYDAFDRLNEYQSLTKDWLFGYLSYDLKNDLEPLSSENIDELDFPALYFFQPKRLFLFSEDSVEIRYVPMVADEVDLDWNAIQNMEIKAETSDQPPIRISLRTSKDRYFEKVSEMLSHIHRGDIYEANFCQEFYAREVKLDPVKTYQSLNT
ncbi:MAG: aminodeoxychorismate synthase component I, partial [Flavobacteriaceae bacterium]|nr:aminodeoxychorismate synthase component I [Flavobacteriaceae bacterium]